MLLFSTRPYFRDLRFRYSAIGADQVSASHGLYSPEVDRSFMKRPLAFALRSTEGRRDYIATYAVTAYSRALQVDFFESPLGLDDVISNCERVAAYASSGW